MNVIVIVSDSMRPDYLGCYGNPRVKTPYIDNIAKEGTLFEEAYSEGVPTGPARTAWFTGKYTFPFRPWQPLKSSDLLLAEVLTVKGYDTAFITDTSPIFWGGFARGFNYHEFINDKQLGSNLHRQIDTEPYFKSAPDMSPRRMSTKKQLEEYLKIFSLYSCEEDYRTPRVIESATRWLRSRRVKDHLFLWVDIFDPHEPWYPPKRYRDMYIDPEYRGKYLINPLGASDYLTHDELDTIKNLYSAEVTFVDKWIGHLYEEIKNQDLLDNTLIMLTSDHGVYLGEHGLLRKSRPWPYVELVRIPFIIRHPEFAGGKKKVGFAETVDLLPTILDFLNISSDNSEESGKRQIMGPSKRVTDQTFHGKSVIPLLEEKKEKIRDFAYAGCFSKAWSIRNEDWSLIYWLPQKLQPDAKDTRAFPLGGKVPGRCELYNRRNDFGELSDVSKKNMDITQHLKLELTRFVHQLP